MECLEKKNWDSVEYEVMKMRKEKPSISQLTPINTKDEEFTAMMPYTSKNVALSCLSIPINGS